MDVQYVLKDTSILCVLTLVWRSGSLEYQHFLISSFMMVAYYSAVLHALFIKRKLNIVVHLPINHPLEKKESVCEGELEQCAVSSLWRTLAWHLIWKDTVSFHTQ